MWRAFRLDIKPYLFGLHAKSNSVVVIDHLGAFGLKKCDFSSSGLITATPIHQVEPNYQNPMPQVLNQSSFVVHKMLLHSISFLSPRFLAETSHPSWLVTATFTISMPVSMPMPWQIWSLLKLHSFQPSQISNIQVMHRFSMSPTNRFATKPQTCLEEKRKSAHISFVRK